MGRGIAFPSVSREQIEELPIPLPPLAEQQRIVTKVDELMVLCDRLEATQAESRKPRFGTPSSRTAKGALVAVALPHLPPHGRPNVPRVPRQQGHVRGCFAPASFFSPHRPTSNDSARSKIAAGSPIGIACRSRSWARRSLSRVSRDHGEPHLEALGCERLHHRARRCGQWSARQAHSHRAARRLTSPSTSASWRRQRVARLAPGSLRTTTAHPARGRERRTSCSTSRLLLCAPRSSTLAVVLRGEMRREQADARQGDARRQRAARGFPGIAARRAPPRSGRTPRAPKLQHAACSR